MSEIIAGNAKIQPPAIKTVHIREVRKEFDENILREFLDIPIGFELKDIRLKDSHGRRVEVIFRKTDNWGE